MIHTDFAEAGMPDVFWACDLCAGAHYILGPFGCDLRRWGLELAERGEADK